MLRELILYAQEFHLKFNLAVDPTGFCTLKVSNPRQSWNYKGTCSVTFLDQEAAELLTIIEARKAIHDELHL